MPTTDVTNTLIANISSTEQTTSNVPINRSTGNPSYSSNVGQFTTYAKLPIGVTNLVLPISPCYQVYIRNIDPVSSITVSWFIAGGGGVVEASILGPNGDQLILWNNPSGAGAGVTQISFTVAAAALVEYFLGG